MAKKNAHVVMLNRRQTERISPFAVLGFLNLASGPSGLRLH